MNAPQWRTVLQWMTAVIDTHCKVSYNKVNENGVVPAKGVNEVLKDMAKAADAAITLQKENKKLKEQLNKLQNTVITNSNYWDCECESNYIHKKQDKTNCDKCGASMDSQPDSIQKEIEQIKKG